MASFINRLLSLFLLALSLACQANEARIAVASNFLLPLQKLARDYQAQTGGHLRISAASTGKLYAQIVNGAPFDVFLAANAREPRKLEQSGHAVPGSRFTYALGRLALWAPRFSGDEPDWGKALLARPGARIALANPAIAPYGAAAWQALEQRGLLPALKNSQFIRGENVSQAYQHVASGATAMGFVAWSQLVARQDNQVGRHWLIGNQWHAPIRQQAVLLRQAAANPAARRFLSYLTSPRARRTIAAFGYDLEPPP